MNKEFDGKKLLVLGANTHCCDIVLRARELGAYVVVADYYKDSPAKRIADESVLIDATDVDALVDYCKEAGIDGVTTGFIDALLTPCYEVCKRLNLPYYATPKMILMATNKMNFKEACEKYNVPVPKTYYVGEEKTHIPFDKLNYPVFVKPLDASGSRGCGICYSQEEVRVRFVDAQSYSPTNNAIVEDYITGREFLMDYVAVNGEFRLLSMFDRYMCDDRGSARNYANLSMAPSKSIDNYLDSMNDRVIDMFKGLGFTDGLFFLQGHTKGERITFYEMGCRLGGSFYKLDQYCIGLNPVDMIVRYALTGKMVDDISIISPVISKFDKYAFSFNALLSGSGETIDHITGYDDMYALSSYVDNIQERGIGTYYEDDRTVDKPLITVYLANSDFEQAKADIRTLNEKIEAYNKDGKALLMHKYDPDFL